MKYKINKKRIFIASIIFLFVFILLFFPRDTYLQLNVPGIKHISAFIKEKTKTKDIYKYFDFSEQQGFSGWKNKTFKGKSAYTMGEKDGDRFLDCKSKNTSSAFYQLVSYDSRKYPFLTWAWRPVKFPSKHGVTDAKLLDDYALRVEVMFASGFFTNYKCIEYVWDEKIKIGTKMASPYSDKIVQLVVGSGQAPETWVIVTRNIFEDYISLFGEKPDFSVRAIAVMCDSEGTKDSSEGNIKEIKISSKELQ
jgi:hypothetical protein